MGRKLKAATIVVAAVAVATYAVMLQPLRQPHRDWLFGRSAPSEECLLETARLVRAGGGASDASSMPMAREVTDEEVTAFHRDGVVVLRGVIQPEWIAALRLLLLDVFEHPTMWDILYVAPSKQPKSATLPSGTCHGTGPCLLQPQK